ncbi:MAG: D-glycerate dehydrogenase, partial [Anaerolineales bacterium]|nr:D-glycerate dehydrogenase [Anaerolineales bacterium]
DVYGATLGIIGFGRIGQAMARRAAGFEMRILFHDPHPPEGWQACGVKAEPVDLEALLEQSDFVSIHTPLNPGTRSLVDANFLAKMKPESILINTSRGPVVDQTALYEALKAGRIAGAALDVTVPEPLPTDSPLLELDNLIITPHIASASQATRLRMSIMAAENLIAGLRGERLPYCVNPEVYSK